MAVVTACNIIIIFLIVNIDHGGQHKKKIKKEEKMEEVIQPVVGGGVKVSTMAPKKSTAQKATDDFHYEKFRKQFKRH